MKKNHAVTGYKRREHQYNVPFDSKSFNELSTSRIEFWSDIHSIYTYYHLNTQGVNIPKQKQLLLSLLRWPIQQKHGRHTEPRASSHKHFHQNYKIRRKKTIYHYHFESVQEFLTNECRLLIMDLLQLTF
jgi:hypothetical protein